MGMTAKDDIDPAHGCGHLQVHIHAVVGNHHHHVGLLLGSHLIHHLLHVLILDAKAPVWDESRRIGDGGVGEGLADHGHACAIDLLDGIGLEGQARGLVEAREVGELVVEQGRVGDRDILGDEFTLEGINILDHLGVVVGELPVTCHDIDAKQVAGPHHVLAPGPEGGARPLPGVATVQ